MPSCAIAYGSPRIPDPKTAFMLLKTLMAKPALPACGSWW